MDSDLFLNELALTPSDFTPDDKGNATWTKKMKLGDTLSVHYCPVGVVNQAWTLTIQISTVPPLEKKYNDHLPATLETTIRLKNETPPSGLSS